MALEVRFKHALKFAESGVNVDHGTVLTYSDSHFVKVGSELVIERLSKLSTEGVNPLSQQQQTKHLLMACRSKDDPTGKNKKLLAYLRGNTDRCAVVILNKDGDVGLLTAITQGERKSIGDEDGYKCFFKPATITIPSNHNPLPSHSPPAFRPSSPTLPPPDFKIAPTSPILPPPSFSSSSSSSGSSVVMYAPSFPTLPPPGAAFRPSSPTLPPPDTGTGTGTGTSCALYAPTSPTLPPPRAGGPTFYPSSPTLPLSGNVAVFRPSSPTLLPPTSALMHASVSAPAQIKSEALVMPCSPQSVPPPYLSFLQDASFPHLVIGQTDPFASAKAVTMTVALASAGGNVGDSAEREEHEHEHVEKRARFGEEQQAAANHYNKLNRDKSERHKSQIFHQRNLSNLIKVRVIQLAAQGVGTAKKNEGISVLDLGCGMGGDILKWFKGGWQLGRYVGVDIAKESLVKFARDRISKMYGRSIVSHLICADLGTESLSHSGTVLDVHQWHLPVGKNKGEEESQWTRQAAPLTPSDIFDVASCQFAVHYMFQTYDKADHFFSEVSRHLRPGGLFVATTIDARVIADLVAEKESGAVDGETLLRESISGEMGPRREIIVRNDLGSMLLRISFTAENWQRLLCPTEQYARDEEKMAAAARSINMSATGAADGNKYPKREHKTSTETSADALADENIKNTFGIQYNFALLDQADATAVDAPEWLVPIGRPLETVCARHRLRVKMVENFHEFLSRGGQQKVATLTRELKEHGVFNYKGVVTEAEWELARLYCVIVFEKMA